MIKKYKGLILFIICHLFLSTIVFLIVKNNFIEQKLFYKSLLCSGGIIIEISILIITILTTYEFLIKQLHFSRYSEKIVGKNIKLYYIYEFIFMILCIIAYCIYNQQNNVSTAISFVLLISLTLFLLLFFFFISKNTLDKLMTNRAKKIKENINKDKFELKIKDFVKLYKESVLKEEYEISKKLVFDYTTIVEELFKNKSKILSCEKMTPDLFEEKVNFLLYNYDLFIVKEKNNFATDMNKMIISELLRLYKQKKKFDQDASYDIMKIIKKILLLDNTLYEVEFLFRTYLVNILEDENLSINEFDDCLNIFLKLLSDGRIAEPYLDIRFIIYAIDKVDTLKTELIEKLIKFRNNCLLNHNFVGLFSFTKELDDYCLKENEYRKCVESYNLLIKYSSFYSSEDKIKPILLLFEDLINDKDRENYKTTLYSMYFEVVEKSFKKIDFIPNMIVPNFIIEDFTILYDDLCKIAYSSIMDENDSYMYHILSTINNKMLENNFVIDEVFEYYDEIFSMISQSSNQNLLNLVISKYIQLYDGLDKNRKLEGNNGRIVIDVVLQNLDNFVVKQNKNGYLFERIFFDLTSSKKDYHFVKKEYEYLIDSLYKKAYHAIEYSDSKVIKFISNIMAWETKKRIDEGTNPSELFRYGLDLLNTLIAVNYSDDVIIFVGTFITTIWAYAKSSSKDQKVQKNKLRFTAYKDINDGMVEYLIKSIALRKNVSKEWNSILESKDYDEKLLVIENELLERKKKINKK